MSSSYETNEETVAVCLLYLLYQLQMCSDLQTTQRRKHTHTEQFQFQFKDRNTTVESIVPIVPIVQVHDPISSGNLP